MRLNGAQILIKQLALNGVSEVFGYPGASVLPVYDVLFDCKDVKHMLAVGESGAVFMADGYARASGRVGVCLATSGPGATNLVTGIASAYMDSVPLVVITGNVPLDVLGHDAFQEVDTSGITMPVTKYSFIVKDVAELSATVARAFELASGGRKGPVVVDIPTNVFTEITEYVPKKAAPEKPATVSEKELSCAINLINQSTHPVVYAGGGVVSADATDALLSFVEKLNAPTAVSMMGLGAIDCNSRYYFGVGTSKNRLAKKVLYDCDLFICLGARLSNKALEQNFTGKKTKLLHVDIDRAEIGKNITEEGRVVGDLKVVLPTLTEAVNHKSDDWLQKVISAKSDINEALSLPNKWINAISRCLPDNCIIATDVGQHQLWTANYYPFTSHRHFISSCGLGSMGYGVGAAVGAYEATGKPVALITGDGSFNMNFNELLTAVANGIPLKVFVMNNGALGMIRELQAAHFSKRYVASDLPVSPDYSALAKSLGAVGYVAKSPDELERLVKTANPALPAVFDCRIGKNEKSL